jgi:hypothetical protein
MAVDRFLTWQFYTYNIFFKALASKGIVSAGSVRHLLNFEKLIEKEGHTYRVSLFNHTKILGS